MLSPQVEPKADVISPKQLPTGKNTVKNGEEKGEKSGDFASIFSSIKGIQKNLNLFDSSDKKIDLDEKLSSLIDITDTKGQNLLNPNHELTLIKINNAQTKLNDLLTKIKDVKGFEKIENINDLVKYANAKGLNIEKLSFEVLKDSLNDSTLKLSKSLITPANTSTNDNKKTASENIISNKNVKFVQVNNKEKNQTLVTQSEQKNTTNKTLEKVMEQLVQKREQDQSTIKVSTNEVIVEKLQLNPKKAANKVKKENKQTGESTSKNSPLKLKENDLIQDIASVEKNVTKGKKITSPQKNSSQTKEKIDVKGIDQELQTKQVQLESIAKTATLEKNSQPLNIPIISSLLAGEKDKKNGSHSMKSEKKNTFEGTIKTPFSSAITLENLLKSEDLTKNFEKSEAKQHMANLDKEISIEHKLEHVDTSIKKEDISSKINHKEVFKNFAKEMRDKIDNYKPPIMKMSIELRPYNLGKVEVTLLTRGDQLKIQINSNTQALTMIMQNINDFKQSLSNVGVNDVAMNFQSSFGESKGEQKNQEQEQVAQNFHEEEEQKVEEVTSLELSVPIYT